MLFRSNTAGLDMEVKYNDFRDASGQTTRVGDAAGIRAYTGSVSLDRSVLPVPWGTSQNFAPSDSKSTDGRSMFPLQNTTINSDGNPAIGIEEQLGQGVLKLHVLINDPDFDTSASGEDEIAQNVTNTNKGPVKVTISRGSASIDHTDLLVRKCESVCNRVVPQNNWSTVFIENCLAI